MQARTRWVLIHTQHLQAHTAEYNASLSSSSSSSSSSIGVEDGRCWSGAVVVTEEPSGAQLCQIKPKASDMYKMNSHPSCNAGVLLCNQLFSAGRCFWFVLIYALDVLLQCRMGCIIKTSLGQRSMSWSLGCCCSEGNTPPLVAADMNYPPGSPSLTLRVHLMLITNGQSVNACEIGKHHNN